MHVRGVGVHAQESRRYRAYKCSDALLETAVGKCLLVVAERPVTELRQPWQIWFCCGEVNWGQGKEKHQFGQLLVPVSRQLGRKCTLSDSFEVLGSRSRMRCDLVSVCAADLAGGCAPPPCLDDRAPFYLIPHVNTSSVWFPEPFAMVSLPRRGEFGVPQMVADRIREQNRDFYDSVLK